MKEKTKEQIEMEEFLTSQGYFKKIEDLKKRRTSSFGITVAISLEIVPEVAQKLGKETKEIDELVKKILL